MRLFSTKNRNEFVTLEAAVRKGLSADNGLYMPEKILPFDGNFIKNIKDYSFPEICVKICEQFFQGDIPRQAIEEIIEAAINFPAPLVTLNENTHVLELFHGPTLAFKDFGARFMARLLAYFNEKAYVETTILVATSGDTGGAVASGFLNVPGIKVVILYPSGKVSELQEKQLTTLGGNIEALEVNGTFDDCQTLVKTAFLDGELNKRTNLCSANSINIARLIPQSFYYFEGYKQLNNPTNVTFVVPSGNYGNLTAGVFAKQMGLPVHEFVAASNANDIVPKFLATGNYTPKRSISTISNAMDVGNPSNFERLQDLFGSTWNNYKTALFGYAVSEQETIQTIRDIYEQYHYLADPHTSVGLCAFKKHSQGKPTNGIVLGTAHPAKFLETMEKTLNIQIPLPEALLAIQEKTGTTTKIENSYSMLKEFLVRQNS